MKFKTNGLIFLLCVATTALAATREYAILGDQKIKAKVRDGMPLPAEKAGVSIEGAGIALGEGKLIWAFDFSSKKSLTKVVVEDVSGKAAVVLITDAAPRLDGDHWMGDATPVPISKSGCPWLFESGDTTKVFRFTVTLRDKSEPIIIYQPAVYSQQTKMQLRKMAHKN